MERGHLQLTSFIKQSLSNRSDKWQISGIVMFISLRQTLQPPFQFFGLCSLTGCLRLNKKRAFILTQVIWPLIEVHSQRESQVSCSRSQGARSTLKKAPCIALSRIISPEVGPLRYQYQSFEQNASPLETASTRSCFELGTWNLKLL